MDPRPTRSRSTPGSREMNGQVVAVSKRIPLVVMRGPESSRVLVVGDRLRHIRDNEDRLDTDDASHTEIIGTSPTSVGARIGLYGTFPDARPDGRSLAGLAQRTHLVIGSRVCPPEPHIWFATRSGTPASAMGTQMCSRRRWAIPIVEPSRPFGYNQFRGDADPWAGCRCRLPGAVCDRCRRAKPETPIRPPSPMRSACGGMAYHIRFPTPRATSASRLPRNSDCSSVPRRPGRPPTTHASTT